MRDNFLKYRDSNIVRFALIGLFLATGQAVPTFLSLLIAAFLAYSLCRLFTSRKAIDRYLPRDDGTFIALARIIAPLALIYYLYGKTVVYSALIPESVVISNTFMRGMQALPGWETLRSSTDGIEILLTLTISALIFAAVGYKTKMTIPAAALLYTLTSSLNLAYYGLWHEGLLPLFVLVVLSFFPASDRFSIDAYLHKPKKRKPEEYGFALFCLWVITASVYVAAGLSKLYHMGFAWADPTNLRGNIIFIATRTDLEPVPTLHTTLPDPIFALVGIGVITMQLLFPVILFSHTARLFFGIIGACFSFAIIFMMGSFVAFYDLPALLIVLLAAFALRERYLARSGHSPPKDPDFTPSRKMRSVLFGIFFVALFQWHAYYENYPLSSWDMYSKGYSELKAEGTISRHITVVQYRADGQRETIDLPARLRILGFPRMCRYGYMQEYEAACQEFYNYAAYIFERYWQRPVARFEEQHIRQRFDASAGEFITVSSSSRVYIITER